MLDLGKLDLKEEDCISLSCFVAPVTIGSRV